MEESKQHVQVPNMDLKEQGLTNSDPYIYACIKRHMNGETKEAFPEVRTIAKESGLNKETIWNSVKRLEAAGYIKIKRAPGKSNTYIFNDYTKFEIFSFDCLDNPELSVKEKSYLIATQQYMFKNTDLMNGNITFTNKELATKIGLSLNTLKKYERSLEEKHILTLVPTQNRDPETGLNVYQRVYNFNEYMNIIALKFLETDDKINNHEDRIAALESRIETLVKSNEILTRQLQEQNKIEQSDIVL